MFYRITARQAKLVLLLFVALLWNCSNKPMAESPKPTCTAKGQLDISSDDLMPSELTDNVRPPVAALVFTPDQEELLIAYALPSTKPSGQLVRFQLRDLKAQQAWRLDPLSAQLTRFNGNGTMLVSAANDHVYAWDTATGQISFAYEARSPNLQDISVSSDGKWLIEGGPGLRIYSPSKERGSSGMGIFADESLLTPVAVALNGAGDFFAFGFREENLVNGKISGMIGLRRWDTQSLSQMVEFNLGPLKWPTADTWIEPVPFRMAIDPVDKWLAILSNNSVELRDILSLSRQAGVELTPTQVGAIAFNPSSSLLAVGYSGGMKVLSVPDLKLVLDKPGIATNALAFSEDGCLLAWGDTHGTIHIISSPDP